MTLCQTKIRLVNSHHVYSKTDINLILQLVAICISKLSLLDKYYSEFEIHSVRNVSGLVPDYTKISK